MSLSTMRAATALLIAGMASPSLAIDESFANARWTIDLDPLDDDSSYLFSGVVHYDGKPLCDDHINDGAASLLCKHFELGNYGEWESADVGTDEFGADDLRCPEHANSLDECTFYPDWEDCSAYEGVRIKCSMWTLVKPPVLEALDYAHDLPKYFGLVHYNMKPLCDDNVDRFAADALCRTMKLGNYGEFWDEQLTGTDEFGADNLDCPLNAESIHDCYFTHDASVEDCASNEGVALLCHDGFLLSGSVANLAYEGFVMFEGQHVCSVGDMTELAANLICQNMGHGTHGRWSTKNVMGDDGTYVTDAEGKFGSNNPHCESFVTDIFDCQWDKQEDFVCASHLALYLECSFDGWTMQPALGEVEHGEDRKHSGFVHYYGKPLCDDYMSSREADMLCHTMYYGDFGDISLGTFSRGGDWYARWETRDVTTDEFGADNLYCPSDSVSTIGDCEWERTYENCDSHEGVWLECHRGWEVEKSIWGGDEGKVAGFLTFDRQTVCVTGFDQNAANAVCRTWYGPRAVGIWQQKVKSSKSFWNDGPMVTLSCPSNAHTVEGCTRGTTDTCHFTEAVHLECV